MLTYDMSRAEGPLYKYLYRCIKKDIHSGNLKGGEKMPSKRTLARNLGISTITVENAYSRLMEEGYLYAKPQRGYFITELGEIVTPAAYGTSEAVSGSKKIETEERKRRRKEEEEDPKDSYWFDFSSGQTDPDLFPFSVWAKISRQIISNQKDKLMEPAPSGGVPELREAIADHLASFRGMAVSPDRIIIGAGAEYLYGMIIKLLGDKKIYAIENPGYRKLAKIYESSGANVAAIRMDHDGILIDELKRTGAAAAHVSPTHHFPTGITMPISRRYELLAWANESPEHYIIEDDFDSEFRLSGSPIPSLQSLDACGKVIYMNTFSKSLAPTIRIGYMVLPWKLVDQYYSKLGFYSCTVSNFEQYTLAAFIREGYFEKHINRTRLYYVRKRRQVLDLIRGYFGERCRILENKAGLHFLLQLDTDREDDTVKNVLKEKGIKIRALSDYYMGEEKPSRHIFLIHYSDMNPEKLKEAMPVLASALSGDCSMLKKKRGKMKSSTAE